MRRTPIVRSLIASALVAALAVAPATAAQASCPSPSLSDLPTVVRLVGHDGHGTPDPAGTFSVTMRDIGGFPIPYEWVMLDLSRCAGARIAAKQPHPGVVTDCPAKTVKAWTNDRGVATMTVVGNAAPGPGWGLRSAGLLLRGCPGGDIVLAAVDLDGANGMGSNDVALWLTDFLSNQPSGRGDYDGNGALGANDLAIWIKFFLDGGSVASAATLPGGLCP